VADAFLTPAGSPGTVGLDLRARPGGGPANTAVALARLGTFVIVTRGGEGAIASLRGTPITVPAPDIEPVDTVGAGDAFTAGLLHHLWRHGALRPRLPYLTAETLESAIAFATYVAGRTCLVPGADPPWAADLLPNSDLAPTAAGGDDQTSNPPRRA
jgi:fructokinase